MNTNLDNPEVSVRDERIVTLDKIVSEVKESEEWEAVQMNILEVGISRGIEQGDAIRLVKSVENVIQNLHVSIEEACKIIGTSEEEFEQAKADIAKNIISKGTRNNEF